MARPLPHPERAGDQPGGSATGDEREVVGYRTQLHTFFHALPFNKLPVLPPITPGVLEGLRRLVVEVTTWNVPESKVLTFDAWWDSLPDLGGLDAPLKRKSWADYLWSEHRAMGRLGPPVFARLIDRPLPEHAWPYQQAGDFSSPSPHHEWAYRALQAWADHQSSDAIGAEERSAVEAFVLGIDRALSTHEHAATLAWRVLLRQEAVLARVFRDSTQAVTHTVSEVLSGRFQGAGAESQDVNPDQLLLIDQPPKKPAVMGLMERLLVEASTVAGTLAKKPANSSPPKKEQVQYDRRHRYLIGLFDEVHAVMAARAKASPGQVWLPSSTDSWARLEHALARGPHLADVSARLQAMALNTATPNVAAKGQKPKQRRL